MHSHDGYSTVTIRELIEALENVARESGDDIAVVLSSDEEGNMKRPMWGLTFWPTYMEFDGFEAELVEDEGTGDWKETPVNCLVIYP